MTRNRLHLVVALVIGSVVLVGGFFLGVQPQLAAAAANRQQQASIEATNETYRSELARLAEQSKELPSKQQELATLEASVPSTPATAAFYKEIDAVASSSGVTVTGITTAWAAAYAPPVSTGTTGGVPASTGTSATPVPSGEPTAAAPTSPVAPATKTDSRITGANFSTIAVSIDVSGSFAQALQFTKGVQSGERLFLVNGITSQQQETAADASAAPTAGGTTWTLSGFVYVLADAKAAQVSQATENASATPAATPSATATPAG